MKENKSLSYCYQCSTCSSGCPVALLTNGIYNPRKIIIESLLGLKDKLIDKQEPDVWLCSTCQKCVELCPQKVDLTEIFTVIKHECFKIGKVPDAFLSQARAIEEHGIAIPYSRPILNRRAKLNLPEIKTASVDEVQKLLDSTGFSRYIKGGGGED
ncbi:MAG: 4Fe-4S dicluster domain-containing protein [Promethearchaeota archaeon]